MIDDHRWHAELIRLLLDTDVFDVQHWESPLAAWNGINTSVAPDLVVLDLDVDTRQEGAMRFGDLPGHLHAQWPDVPVVLLSEEASADQIRRSSALGIAAFVAKPYDVRYLFATICRQLAGILDAHTAELNRQHIAIAGLFRRLIADPASNLADAATLDAALHRHFDFEESFMLRHAYPQAAAHAGRHAELLKCATTVLRRRPMRVAALERLWRDVNGDVNDDQAYVVFLAGIQRMLQDRLGSRAGSAIS